MIQPSPAAASPRMRSELGSAPDAAPMASIDSPSPAVRTMRVPQNTAGAVGLR